MIPKRKWTKRGSVFLLLVFVGMNIVTIFHSYKFTHFSKNVISRTKNPSELSLGEKVKALVFGVSIPRPINKSKPEVDFKTIILESDKTIECWLISQDSALGTVVLFHGYGGEKSSMLDKAEVFNSLGYSTFLVDFMGSGNSEGNQTSIGYHEAEQVKTCVDYLSGIGEENVFLFGTSMGAVAIMKSVYENKLDVKGIILECPFGTMYETVCARFSSMNVPTFPMAGLLMFWGGIQNSYWAFGHNPVKYATKINVPTLLMSGGVDEKVSLDEVNSIYSNISGPKRLKIYQRAGHENYLNKYRDEWSEDVRLFLATITNR